MGPSKTTQKPAKSAASKPAKSTASKTASKGWTAEEKAAAKAYAKELKAEAQGANDEKAALEAIAAMPKEDRVLAERVHAIVKEGAPSLSPKTWYGMPAYANKDGKVVCFFQNASKFKARYATLGFNDAANLDDGSMWPVAFAVKNLTSADEAKIVRLLKKAVK